MKLKAITFDVRQNVEEPSFEATWIHGPYHVQDSELTLAH
jgi:hypothetical protein